MPPVQFGDLLLRDEAFANADVIEMADRTKGLIEQRSITNDREVQPIEPRSIRKFYDGANRQVVAVAVGIERPDHQDIKAVGCRLWLMDKEIGVDRIMNDGRSAKPRSPILSRQFDRRLRNEHQLETTGRVGVEALPKTAPILKEPRKARRGLDSDRPAALAPATGSH